MLVVATCKAFVPSIPAIRGIHSSAMDRAQGVGRLPYNGALLMTASEFGGIQHAGVLVSDVKASKVVFCCLRGGSCVSST